MLPLATLSLGLWVDPIFIAGHQSIKNCGIWIDQLDHLPAVMTTSLFLIFSGHPWDKLHTNLPHLQFLANNCVYSSHTDIKNCALIVSIDTRRSLSLKFFIWRINCGVLTSLLLPHLSSSLTDSLPSLNLLCNTKTDADSCKMVEKQSEVFHTFLWLFSKFKTEFYCISFFSKVLTSRLHFWNSQLWQSGFSRVYSNCCCRCSFEPEIIKIGQSSHKMYRNKILNFQNSMTIIIVYTKKVWKNIEGNL